MRARGGYANYRHDEIEDTGEIGSSFFSKGGEGRLELVQSERSGWGGTSGVQYLKRNAKNPRRGEIPARQPAAADRTVHAADLCHAARSASRAGPGSSSAS